MTDKIIFLVQVYFAFSFLSTILFTCYQFRPSEIRWMKRNKIIITWKGSIYFIKNILILLVAFPIIAIYLGIKEM